MAIYTGSVLNSLILTTCVLAGSWPTFVGEAGLTYHIQLGARVGMPAADTISLRASLASPPVSTPPPVPSPTMCPGCTPGPTAPPVPTQAPFAVSEVSMFWKGVKPNESVTVELLARASSPGIGEYQIDVLYDDRLTTATVCETSLGTCEISSPPQRVRFTREVTEGLVGDITLGTVTFRAGAIEAATPLDIRFGRMADAAGNPGLPSISPGGLVISKNPGEFGVAAAAAPAAVLSAVSLPRTGDQPVVLPTSGSGSELPGPRVLGVLTFGAAAMMLAGTVVTAGGVGMMRVALRVNADRGTWRK